MKIKCPLCDYENEEGSKFCKNCNGALMTNQKEKNNFIKYFIILTVFMLVGAIAEWSYGYYTLLRWVSCIASILIAFQVFEKNIDWAKVVFIVIAILFNPLFPIYLSRSAWIPLDIITAILFLFAIKII